MCLHLNRNLLENSEKANIKAYGFSLLPRNDEEKKTRDVFDGV